MIDITPGDDVFKLTIQPVDGGDSFTFPIEPQLSIRRRNRIIKKYPQKGRRGTIKERWTVDDFDITIRATFIGEAGYLKELEQQIIETTPSAGDPEKNTLGNAVRQRLKNEVTRVKDFTSALIPTQVAGALGAIRRAGDVDQLKQLSPSYPFDTLATLLELCSYGYWLVSGNDQLNKLNITHYNCVRCRLTIHEWGVQPRDSDKML